MRTVNFAENLKRIRKEKGMTVFQLAEKADDMVKANAEFAASSGLTAKIVRSTSGECCAWCSSIAGTYTYGSEPKDVYRRYNNCDCTVEYVI